MNAEMGAGLPPLWDIDLLIGRDPETGTRVEPNDVRRWMDAADIHGGVLGSQQAVAFDAASGNAEAAEACRELPLTAATTLDVRDYLGGREILRAAPPAAVIRLAPNRQDAAAGSPGFGALARLATERGFLLLCEGDIRLVGPALSGMAARVVFLDTHFYALGDFVALAEREPGFHTSTRLLAGPDSIEQIRDHVGVERLIFGSRNGFHEGQSVLERLAAADLSAGEMSMVAAENLRRLMGDSQ